MNDTTGTNITSCFYCGYIHDGICPRIEEIEYHPDGSTKRVKFKNHVPAISWRGGLLVPFEIGLEPITSHQEFGHECGRDCIMNTC